MIKLLEKYLPQLKEKFSETEVLAYPSVSTGMFSVAKYYGGATINGKRFTHFPEDDLLVREDVVKFVKKLAKKKPVDKGVETVQESLPL